MPSAPTDLLLLPLMLPIRYDHICIHECSMSNNILQSFVFYRSGVYYEPTCGNTDADLDHEVLAIGYGTDATVCDYHDSSWWSDCLFYPGRRLLDRQECKLFLIIINTGFGKCVAKYVNHHGLWMSFILCSHGLRTGGMRDMCWCLASTTTAVLQQVCVACRYITITVIENKFRLQTQTTPSCKRVRSILFWIYQVQAETFQNEC